MKSSLKLLRKGEYLMRDYPTYSIIVCTLDNISGLMEFIKTLLRQKYLPEDLIVVHGRPEGNLVNQLLPLLHDTGVRLVYAACQPGLVHQRNLGLELCKSEIVMFFDDDVLLEIDYIKNLLDIYKSDPSGAIGGAQGFITNMPESPKLVRFLKRFFMLYTGYGSGRMYPSGMPSWLSPESDKCETCFFAGCLMSFRMSSIANLKFDEKLHPYWWGDDFEFCYRIAQKYLLVQTNKSRLAHKGSSVNKNSFRRFWRMQVVNHLYIFKKHRRWFEFPFYIWSLSANSIFAVSQFLKGYGMDGILGYLEGLAEIFGIIKTEVPADKWYRNLVKIGYWDTSKQTEKVKWKETYQ
ncbi:MAG: glycosyltransferase family 2 protein [candidate division Zixibacteria bacterium]|nr:glycosyltransferase family 2 protein [candidate division Zixibacteria bacterium]